MADELGDSSYKQVQGLTRGLAVLRALTASTNGRAQISDISAATKLHRTTVRRLLETLGVEGFVERSGDDGAFQLTQEIKRLADNFSVFDNVAAAAADVLRDLTAEVTWPCSLATPYEHMMEIRAATHHLSPLSFHRGVIGRRLPMLLTSMGRAYLAFSSNVVRERTLDLITARYELGEVPLMSLSTFRQILAKTQEDGYGSNFGDWTDDKKVAAIAVPVRGERNTVVACVNVVAITRATKPQQLAAKYLEPLRAAAKRIEKAL